MGRLRSLSLIGLVGSSSLLWACDDPGVTAPTAGSLQVTVVGFPPGQRGLSLVKGTTTRPFITYDPHPHILLRGLEPGEHAFELVGLPSGIPADCAAPAGTSQTVTVVASVQRTLQFDVDCTWGTFEITTTTNGVQLDPDGYVLQMIDSCYNYYNYYYCGGSSQIAVPTNGTVVAKITDNLYPAIFDVTLEGVAGNCSASPSPSQYLNYPLVTSIEFTVTCTAASTSRSSPR